MPTVVIVRGAANAELLSKAVPQATVHEVDTVTKTLAEAADVLVLRSGVELGAAQLAAWPALKHVIRAGSGLDGIDTGALAARGVTVHRNPQPAAGAVAEWALAALLCLARRIPYGHATLRAGQHAKAACLTKPVAEMRLAIWGAGPIGRACGRVVGPHVADLVYASRTSIGPGLPQRPAADLAGWADAHLVALPLTPGTRRRFGTGFLAAAGARRPLLICVGRLDTLDVPACLDALRAGTLSGLGLDPVEREHLELLPAGGPALNLLATPHIGAQRTDVRTRLDRWVADTACAVLTGHDEEGQ